MRHNKAGRRLGRTTSHRIAMMRNMVTSLFDNGSIVTTDAKAKELRPVAEKLITLGKRSDLHAIRQAASYIRDKKVVTKLFNVIAKNFSERPGGYTRIVKLGFRSGDTAPLSKIELIQDQYAPKAKKLVSSTPAVKCEVIPSSVESESKTSIIEQESVCEANKD